MVVQQLLHILGNIITVAFVLFVLNWWKESRATKRAGRISRLHEQLANLYGPLHFFMSQNKQFVERNRKVLDAYKGHFEGKTWAPEAEETVDQEMKDTIDLANAYVEKIRENNGQVMQVLHANWHLIDLDDVEVFSEFQVHFTRDQTEFRKDQKKQIPISIRLALGDVHFYHSQWVDHVNSKWMRKREELAKLGTH